MAALFYRSVLSVLEDNEEEGTLTIQPYEIPIAGGAAVDDFHDLIFQRLR